jgi:transcriptional regulator with XRE-family HTH domain
MSFGEQVRFWRSGRGITQQRLAERAGMHVVQISKIERDKGNPTVETMLRIAEALDAKLTVSIIPKDGNPEIRQWI